MHLHNLVEVELNLKSPEFLTVNIAKEILREKQTSRTYQERLAANAQMLMKNNTEIYPTPEQSQYE
jgi:hypothetical protein